MIIKTGQTYRNDLGVELMICDPAYLHLNTLGGDGIWIARADHDFSGPTEYLVTAESLTRCGYVEVQG